MAKQGLRKICILKDQFGLRLERNGREERRGEEEEEEEKMEEPRSSQQGMETHLHYESYKIWHGSLAWYDYYCPQTWGFARVSS